MRVFGITVCHMDPDIIAFSLNKVRMTMGSKDVTHWVLIDNHWPIRPGTTYNRLLNLSFMWSPFLESPYELLSTPKNEGGLAGFNYALNRLNQRFDFKDDDLIFGIDPDTNPITMNWGVAMQETMLAHPELDAVSFMIKSLKPIRPWQTYAEGPHKLVKHFDMYNATCWRYRAIKDGLKANLGQYYGGVELGMRHLNHAYLYDFEEDHCPIPHPQCYNDWKRKHAFEGYKGNFDQYVKEFHPELLD